MLRTDPKSGGGILDSSWSSCYESPSGAHAKGILLVSDGSQLAECAWLQEDAVHNRCGHAVLEYAVVPREAEKVLPGKRSSMHAERQRGCFDR